MRERGGGANAQLFAKSSIRKRVAETLLFPPAGFAGRSAESARMDKNSMESSEKDSAGSIDKQSAQSGETPDSTDAPAGHEGFDYSQIAEEHRIHPRELTLVKFVGSGGYGEVYLGKWHSSEAAIKCLNPSLFFNAGQVTPPPISLADDGFSAT